ncbi:OmpA family protein [Chryseobacterium sp. MP_3.2]|uniref:OmpA family protein n=1 Tax=Chryseobacterium sp. MP_3.2 TaxID=3071712 RepID=UPI002E01C552|nr:outer membrane protein OmpA-like peptidoglycan-associated protein [Chryseobacterium sp. MP_3.2]
MSLNVIDLIKGQLGPATVSQAASQLGESESGISKAISGFLPAILGGLANNADKPGVLDSITGAASSGLLGNLLGGSSNNSMIATVLTAIFGDKVGGLVNAVSGYAGVSNSSSNSLLNMVAGAALGSIGKYAADNNMDASGVSSLLQEQKGVASSLLPAGLSMASLGMGDWLGGADDVTHVENINVTPEVDQKIEVNRGGNTHVEVDKTDDNGGGSIWKWLLPLLLLALAAWFLWKQCDSKPADTTTTTTDSTAMMSDSIMTAMPLDSSNSTTIMTDSDIDLNGTMIKGYKGGMEDNMITFLKSDGYTNATDDAALKDTWYSFDKVNFKMGSASELEAASAGQMENLVAILKAYQNAKIKIGGYTDKVGNEASNVKLSTDRANYIKSWLTDKGVGAQILGAEGYGSQFAMVDATSSDAERAVDRKMAVRFAK